MKFFSLLLLCFALKAYAAEDFYQFASQNEARRFTTLTTQLRCLVCQNQNLSQSNSGLAIDLRNQIYQKIMAGQSDQAILNYLTERYGKYILYRPPVDKVTFGLWFGPFILLAGSLSYLFFYLRKKSREE